MSVSPRLHSPRSFPRTQGSAAKSALRLSAVCPASTVQPLIPVRSPAPEPAAQPDAAPRPPSLPIARPHGPFFELAAHQPARADSARQPLVRAALILSTLAPALWTDRLFPHSRCQCCFCQRAQRLRRCLRPRRSARGCPRWLGRRARACAANQAFAAVSSVGCPVGQDQSILIAW